MSYNATPNTMKRLLSLTLVLLLSSCIDNQFLLNRGKQSYMEDKYRQSFIRLLPVARRGNSEAQYALGYMYFNGQGVTEDRTVGKEWIQKSALQGNKKAIRALEIIRNTPPSRYQPKGREIIGDGR